MHAHLEIIVCKFGCNPAICPQAEAIFVPAQKCPYHVTFDLTLTLSTLWMRAHLETMVCDFGRNPAICLRQEAIFVPAQKCPYHVTFDLDLEHTLDARSPGDHRVQVWLQSSHLCRRSDLCKTFQTDRQTDDGRHVMVLVLLYNFHSMALHSLYCADVPLRNCSLTDGISSWNELKINSFLLQPEHR